MNSISDIFGESHTKHEVERSSKVVSNSLVGVEIELENLSDLPYIDNEPRKYSKYWDIVNDGSLRGEGAEFVLSKPLGGKKLVLALQGFNRIIESKGWKPILSDRTSVHIHIDVRDLSRDQLENFIILFIIFERVLFKFSSPERHDNIFCQGFESSQDIYSQIACQFSSANEDYKSQLSTFQKYSSCNIGSVYQHGSLEFRLHCGEFRSTKLLHWINILLSIKEYTTNNELKKENLPSEISCLGEEIFLDQVFGKFSQSLKYPEVKEDILQGIRLAQDVLYDEVLNLKTEEIQLYSKKQLGDISPFEKYLNKHKLPEVKTDTTGWEDIIFRGV